MRILRAGGVRYADRSRGYVVDYRSALPATDSAGIDAEAAGLWDNFRPAVERAGFRRMTVIARTTASLGMLYTDYAISYDLLEIDGHWHTVHRRIETQHEPAPDAPTIGPRGASKNTRY